MLKNRKLSAIKRQPKSLDDFAGNEVSPLPAYLSFIVVKLRFGQQMNPVAANHGFPIQPVGFVQHFFGHLRPPVCLGRRAKERVDLLDIRILAGLIIGNNHRRMPPFFAERKHENIPLFHKRSLFEIFGAMHHRSFGQPIILLDFSLAVNMGEITRLPHRDGFDFRDFLQNEPAPARNNINRLPPAGFRNQAAQIRFGVAQREHLRTEIDFRFSRAFLTGNFHRLNVACIQPGVERFLQPGPVWAVKAPDKNG